MAIDFATEEPFNRFMATFSDLTAAQFRHIIHLKERIEYLQGLLASLRGTPTKKKVGRPRTASLGTACSATIRPPMVQKRIISKGGTKVAATMKARRSARKKAAR